MFYEGPGRWTPPTLTPSNKTSAHWGWGGATHSGGRWDSNKSITSRHGSSANAPWSHSHDLGRVARSRQDLAERHRQAAGTAEVRRISRDCGLREEAGVLWEKPHKAQREHASPLWPVWCENDLLKLSKIPSSSWVASFPLDEIPSAAPSFSASPALVQPSCSYLWP